MVRSRTEVFYGTIDCFAIAMNLLSFIALKKFSRMFSSELIILIGSITILSLSGCTLFVTKMLKNFDGPGNLASLASLAVPISYNLFLPAILSKGFKQLHPEDKHHVSCSYLYAIVCCSLVVFFVMVISPMPGMDYHKFQQPVHAPHPGLHTSVATPLLMICGAVPQLFAAFLSLIQVNRISGSMSCCRRNTAIKHSTFEDELVKKYLRRWGLASICLVLPSAIISVLGFILWKFGQKLPDTVGFCHALCDSLLFLTQPTALLVLWLTYKLHELNTRLDKKLYERSLAKQTNEGGVTSSAGYILPGPVVTEVVSHAQQQPQISQQNSLEQTQFLLQQPNIQPIVQSYSNGIIPPATNGMIPVHRSLDQVAATSRNSVAIGEFDSSPKKLINKADILNHQHQQLLKSHSFSANSSPSASVSYIQSEV